MTVAAALHQLSVVKCVVLLTGEKQHLFLSRQHNSGLCSPEYPALLCFVHLPVQQVWVLFLQHSRKLHGASKGRPGSPMARSFKASQVVILQAQQE